MVRNSRLEKITNGLGAIFQRAKGESYDKVLEEYKLTADQFYAAVLKLQDHLEYADIDQQDTLARIATSREEKIELFRMEKQSLIDQYERIQGDLLDEPQKEFKKGTLIHPDNKHIIVYYALSKHHPKLGLSVRETVIEGIKELPDGLYSHFASPRIGLLGLMANTNGHFEPREPVKKRKGKKKNKRKKNVELTEKKSSPHMVIHYFNLGYQAENSDASLFDLEKDTHLHIWNEHFRTPTHWYNDSENVITAVSHTLIEEYDILKNGTREQIVECIRSFPSPLAKHFYDLGLRGLMQKGFKGKDKNSPKKIIEIYNKWYLQNRQDTRSLFHRGNAYKIEFDGNGRIIQ